MVKNLINFFILFAVLGPLLPQTQLNPQIIKMREENVKLKEDIKQKVDEVLKTFKN